MPRSPYASAALLPGVFIGPRMGGAYPLDLDASLRYTRPPTGVDFFPYPPMIGWIQGFLPMQNGLVGAGLWGKNASGPWTAPVQIRAAGEIFVSQDTKTISPEWPKVQG